MTKERITSETKFRIDRRMKYCAYSYIFPENIIVLGKHTITLETLIHEICETELTYLLHIEWKITKDSIEEHQVTHLISPYGINSLICPCASNIHELPVNEEFLYGP